MWIESHDSLKEHPKTRKASRLLGITVPQMIGHLHCLWWWCANYVPDGDLSNYSDEDIAEAALWEGDPSSFIHALLHCGIGDRPGFLEEAEGGRVLHDWHDYLGRLLDRRSRDRERQRNKRSTSSERPEDVLQMSVGHPTDVQRTSSGCPADVQRMSNGCPADVLRMSDGCPTDVQRMSCGCPTDVLRMSDGRPADVQRTSVGCPAYRTVPYRTVPKEPIKPKDIPETSDEVSGAGQAPAPLGTREAPPGSGQGKREKRPSERGRNTGDPPVQENGGLPEHQGKPEVTRESVPRAFRETYDLFLLRTGRSGISREELARIEALEKLHVPSRVQEEISTALERFRRMGREPCELDWDYLWRSLRNQKSGVEPARSRSRGSPKEVDPEWAEALRQWEN